MTVAASRQRARAPPLLVVDIETTGLGHIAKPPRPDGIVQVAFAWREGPHMRSWATLVKPLPEHVAGGRADQALAIQRRTLADLADAPDIITVKDQVWALIERLGFPPLTSYNVGFDRPFLEAQPWGIGAKWASCIMLDAAHHINGPNGRWLKLAEAAHRLGVEHTLHESLHDARSDVLLALMVREKLDAIRGGDLAGVDVVDLLGYHPRIRSKKGPLACRLCPVVVHSKDEAVAHFEEAHR